MDLNGDGVPDVQAEESSGSILLRGLPREGSASPDVNANHLPDECEPDCDRDGLPDACEVQVAADFDGNGSADLALLVDVGTDANPSPKIFIFESASRLAVYLGLGDGTFEPGQELDLDNSTLPALYSIAAGDLDGDGYPDLAGPQGIRGSAIVLFNRTLPARSRDTDRDEIPNECAAATGGQVPSDGNQDGKLDLSDAVWVLGRLFGGAASPWPCDGGLATDPDPANVRLLDTNGDGILDIADPIAILRHLFFGGESPTLGSRCVAIGGCPERCLP